MRKVVGPWAREARKRPHGRSLADFLPLLTAEGRLREAVATGEICELAADCRRARQMLALRFVLPPGEYADAVAQVLADEDAPGPLKAILRAETGLVGDKPLLYDVCVATLRQHEARSELQSGEARPQSAVPAETEALTARTEELPEIVRDFPRELVRIASRHLDTPKDGWRAALDTDPDALLAVYTEVAERYRREVMGWRSVDESDPDVVVRGSFVRFLALGGDDATPVHEKGIHLDGAVVKDTLDLESAADARPLHLVSSRLTQPLIIRNAALKRLDLTGSYTPGIDADSAALSENALLRLGFRSEGTVALTGATIGGNLTCLAATLLATEADDWNDALCCDGVRIAGDVFLTNGFRAEAEVRFLGATIGGDLDCEDGRFINPASKALSCDRAKISGDALLGRGLCAMGEVRMLGATIGGNLACGGGWFTNPTDDPRERALECSRVSVSGRVFLDGKLRVNGEVRLEGATIGSDLDCSGSSFRNNSGSEVALCCDGIKVRGNILFCDGFRSEGAVLLRGAELVGNLACRRGTFLNLGKVALDCDRTTFRRGVFLNSRFHAAGEVRLLGATIGGNLVCAGGTLFNATSDGRGTALRGNRASIAGDIDFRDKFQAFGRVRLLGVTVGGDIACKTGTFDASPVADRRNSSPTSPSATTAIQLQGAKISRGLFLREARILGGLDLTGAHCGLLADDPAICDRQTIDAPDGTTLICHLSLDGFAYDRVGGARILRPEERIRWLDRQPESHLTDSFRPQPWEQLAKVYRASGHEDWARVIAKEKQRRLMRLQRQAAWATLRRGEEIWRGAVDLAVWLVSWLFRGLLGGYGYAVKRLFVIPLAVWLLCAQLFDQAAEQGLVVPSAPILVANKAKPGDPDTVPAACRANWTRCPPPTLPTEYRRFSPHLYSADLLLPFVSFGQEDAWTPLSVPDLPRQTSATVPARPDSSMKLQGLYGWIDWRLPWWAPRLVMWSEIVAGWLMGVLVVGVLSGLVKKD